MKTGDSFNDDHGQTWTVDAALGRGVWARTWALRGSGGAVAVLKAPLRSEDLGDRADGPALVAHALTVGRAVRRQLTEQGAPWLPPILGLPVSGDAAGDAAFIIARYQADLESRLQAGMELGDVVDHLAALAALLMKPGTPMHGNLHPANILLDQDGRPVLVDPRPEGVDEAWMALTRAVPGRVSYLPPEGEAGRGRGPGWDTWALCQILHRATHAASTSDDPRRGHVVEPPRGGISRVALATLKDAAAARLRDESANLRFAARATERLGAVLSRGLSLETDPSPPYRFRNASELQPRLAEVADLIHPAVSSVSKPSLEGASRDGVIEAGAAVELAVNVSTTTGVTAQDDIACGVQLRDLDAPDQGRVRVPNARFTVKTYPSGRFRFHFTLPDVAPGRYQARVAFSVKGSESNAIVAECGFQVRPHVGYVPPPAPAPTAPAALPFQPAARKPELAQHKAKEAEEPADAPVGEIIQFPRRGGPPAPIRPPNDGEPEPERHEPPTVATNPMDVPVAATWPPLAAAPDPDLEARSHGSTAWPAASGWSGPAVAAGPPPLAANPAIGAGVDPRGGAPRAPAPSGPNAQAPRPPTDVGALRAEQAASRPAEPPRSAMDHLASRPPDAGRAPAGQAAPARVTVASPAAVSTPPLAAELPPLAEPQDYPSPGRNNTFGTDLPIYEAPRTEHTPVLRAAWDWLVRRTGDAFSAFMALVASALTLLILVAMLARSC